MKLYECMRLDNNHVQRYAECPACGETHWFMTSKLGLKIDAYNIKWKAKKDEMRRKHYKDLLQPTKDGKDNPEFIKAYGKIPYVDKRKQRSS